MRKQLLSILLTFCMVVSLMPTAAYAGSDEQAEKVTASNERRALQLGMDAVTKGQHVYMGIWADVTLDYDNKYPIEWRVLDNETSKGGEGLFLLSEKSLGAEIFFRYDSQTGAKWDDSRAKNWCINFQSPRSKYPFFSDAEYDTFLLTYETETSGSNENNYQDGDRMFFLSQAECENTKYFNGENARQAKHHVNVVSEGYPWLLRDYNVIVGMWGYVESNLSNGKSSHAFPRPAFNMSRDYTIMTSAAENGKKDETVDSKLTAVEAYSGNSWKLTLRDGERKSFTAKTDTEELQPGQTVSVSYSGAKTGENEYISAMLVDAKDNVYFYGRLAKAQESGTVQVTVPTGLTESSRYGLKIFNEQCNGDCKTDYSSDGITVGSFSVGKSIEIGTDRPGQYDLGYDCIYYGEKDGEPIKWRILDTKTNSGEKGMFLLSEKVFGTGEEDGVYFNQDTAKGNKWQGSDAQKWCQDFAENSGTFSETEAGEIIAVNKSDPRMVSDNTGVQFWEQENALQGDKVFFLSAIEAYDTNYGFRSDADRATSGENAGNWWLRSVPALSSSGKPQVGLVVPRGSAGSSDVCYSQGARPAMNISMDKIFFVSKAGGSKADPHADENLIPVTDYSGNSWKLTLKDESRNSFTASASQTKDLTAGQEINISYSGAKTGKNEYVSAMIADEKGNLLYYGRIAKCEDESAERRLRIPSDLAPGSYTLKLYSEQYNGEYGTDLAGNFVEIPLTVSREDTTNPEVKINWGARSGPYTATVKFESSEPGYYYIGINQPPDTTGKGTSLDNTNPEIEVTGLTPNQAHAIYIVVKDFAGNVSAASFVNISADPKYTVTLDANKGTIATGKNVYQYTWGQETKLPEAGDVTREGYTFAGWYAEEDFSGEPVTAIPADSTGDLKFYAKWQVVEQFNLTRGGTYYFDLLAMQIPGTPNSGTTDGAASLPDTTLHYVPFTYAGTVDAYKLGKAQSTDDAYARENSYAHSLFVAENNVTNQVSWNDLNEKNMIFGTDYKSNGITYSLRTPSAGSRLNDNGTEATPTSNEWDSILGNGEEYIKNWNQLYAWGQETYRNEGTVLLIGNVARGNSNVRNLACIWQSDAYDYLGFRPVLEILNENALGTDSLKAVTLQLGGGKLGENTEDIQVIVKSGASFKAPVCEGLIPPEDCSADGFKWLGSNGNTYAPGTSVPAEVTSLTAQWSTNKQDYTVTLDANGGSFSDRTTQKQISYTSGDGLSSLSTEIPSRDGYDFKGWYADSSCTGTMITSIGAADTGDKTFYAKWVEAYNPLTILELESGKVYCGAKKFSIGSRVGAVIVKAGEQTLEPYPAGSFKFTLPAGLGRVTVTAAVDTIGGASTSVTVYSNSGHTPAQDDGDCSTPVKCLACGEVTTAAKQHSFADAWSKDSSSHWHGCQNEGCTAKGNEAQHSGGTATCINKARCEICGAQYGNIGSSNHNLREIAPKEATCTKSGNIAYYICNSCGKWFSDEQGNIEITDKNSVIVLATGHKSSDWITDTQPTETTSGTKHKECTVCKIVLEQATIPAIGSTSGGSSLNDDVKTDTDSTTSKTTTSTTIKDTKTETIKDDNGNDISKITATVSDKVADKLVDQAVSNKSDTVEITVKSDDGNKVDSEKQVELEIPKSAVKDIADKTDASLVINTDNGQVVLDNKTLETIASETEGDTVKIAINENTQLKESQKPAADVIGDNGYIFDLRAYLGDKLLHDFKGGKAHVTLPMPEKLKGKDVAVIYINDEGICEILNHTVKTVGADKYIRFTTTHLSTYAIVESADAEKLIKQQNQDKANTLIKEAKLKASTSKTSKKNVKVTIGVNTDKSLIKELKSMGYTVKYKYYRSTKKASKYTAVKTKTGNTYINTTGKKGTKYYYKAKVLVYDGKSLVAQTTLKQCSYGVRTWSK